MRLGTDDLRQAMLDFDELATHRILGELFHAVPADEAVTAVVMPFLREVGELWDRGEIGVAQEHFASNLVRHHLAHQTFGTARGPEPVVLACPPGELHDIPLLAFGLVLSRRGAAVRFLGASTPMAEVAAVTRAARGRAVTVSASRPTALQAQTGALRHLAQSHLVAVAGPGAGADLAEECGLLHLREDPVASAEALLVAIALGGTDGLAGAAHGRVAGGAAAG